MTENKQQAEEQARRVQEQKRRAAEQAAARLRARDVTEQLSARTAEQARKAVAGPSRPRTSWLSVVIILVILVVVVILAYGRSRGFGF